MCSPSANTHERITHYDVLDVDSSSTANDIRKAYLRKSLQYHPDKNPADPESAKSKFIEIGAAYETLSDPVKRRKYDKELRCSESRAPGSSTYCHQDGRNNFDGSFSRSDFSEQKYDNYRDIFDATVAGMNEDELAVAVGSVAALAGIVGSIIGSRIFSGGRRAEGRRSFANEQGGNTMIAMAGSAIGSLVASEVAASSARLLHEDCVERIAYKEECRRAVARGHPMPDPPIKPKLGKALERALDSIKIAAQAKMGDNMNNNQNDNNRSGRDRNSQSHSINEIWRIAAEGMRAVALKRNDIRSHRHT